ncbi:8621_t:CDS:2 [Paraglomus brasilianum]|uniref:8621_t:CDS:1 n=1 Tax=Paraglomus brasilianum TaxID=144538 RepID=A0A9N8VZ30_9GLOM|nr:8621_t:CDS:2 [Paraglomus brasilianum]
MPPNVTSELILDDSKGPKTFRRADIVKSLDHGQNQTDYSVDEPWYVVIDNKVYDVRDFARDHPGGAVILTHVGKDGTDAFSNFHPESAYEILANFYVGDIAAHDMITTKKGFTTELRDIKQQFKELGYFKSSKAYYTFKVLTNLSILAITLSILFRYGGTLSGVLLSSFFMGAFWQQCGWLSHDFLHHQVFEQRIWNNVMGHFLGAICLGFSPSWWKDKHNTHHASPNVHGQDPDISTHPILTWSEYALSDLFASDDAATPTIYSPEVSRFLVKYQPLLYFPILHFARISWCIQSLLFVLPGWKKIKENDPRMPVTPVEFIGLVVHHVWYFVTLYLFVPKTWLALTFYFTSQAMGGLLIALVFALNHNGMKILTMEESHKMDFFAQQVVTGRDVIASNPSFQWCIDWFCGGLNYQIEHHLFPTMPRHHFHKVQPSIQLLCEKYNIPYHRTTFIKGTQEVLYRLGQVSDASWKLA